VDIWEELDIEATTDIRAVRRAYAVKLKVIDQAAEPERFERLRAAYTYALTLAEQEPAALEPVDNAAADDLLLSPPDAEPVPAAAPSEEPGSPRADIQAIYAQVLEGAESQSTEQLSERLLAALDGILDLKTREELELLVLNDVFTPRPFREHLMTAAAKTFGWNDSLRHLADRSYDAAREMYIWLQERGALEAGIASQGWRISQPLNWATEYYAARERGVPLDDEARIVEAIQFMQRAFPTVLRYRIDAGIVDYWLERARQVDGDTLKHAASHNTPKAPAKRGFRPWWAIIVLMSALASITNTINRPERRTEPYPLPSTQIPLRDSGCERLKALNDLGGILSFEEQRELAQCRREDLLRGGRKPDSGLGLKPPEDLRPQAPDER
jgi:protein TonB